MFENQALEPRIFEDLERVRGSSTPNPGTIQDRTFNLFSILADQHLTANSLFWITVRITAFGPRSGDSVSRLKLRGSRLVDAEPGLLGQVAKSRSIWLEGVEPMIGGACGSDLGRVMDGWRQ